MVLSYRTVLRSIQGVWLHIEGETSPHFNNNGYVDKTDAAGSLINDMRSFLHAAKRYNVFVFFVLWNGAKKQATHYRYMYENANDLGQRK